ncbi:miraculin-like [Silene latifolia]|uniref:miraculin-like n=1 Tax=Silene latifolia TaxID=37657 RepID=UPI003D7729A0
MYYILPSSPGHGGGLQISPRNRTSPCPLYVTQHNVEIYPGLPVWFLPTNPKDTQITASTDYNILFNVVNPCLESAVWQLVQEAGTRKRYVATGGDIGNPGNKTVYSWFQIEKAGAEKYEYKIVFCPSVCPSCMLRCGHLGVFVEKDGSLFLGVAGRALLISFKKA